MIERDKEEYIEEGINGQWTDWKFEAKNYEKIYKELQQRIDKAIEYIKSKKCKYDGWEITTQLYEDEIKQLEEILKGKEE